MVLLCQGLTWLYVHPGVSVEELSSVEQSQLLQGQELLADGRLALLLAPSGRWEKAQVSAFGWQLRSEARGLRLGVRSPRLSTHVAGFSRGVL